MPPTMPDGSPWPVVSIVTPSYNQGRYLEETIRSVLLQGYPSLEYLIVDGGSTDDSVQIIREYEPWLAYWVSEPDRGQSHAINKGWAHATGQVCAWLNSDDWYQPGTLARPVTTLSRRPGVGLAYGRARICEEDGGPSGRYSGRPFDLEELAWGRNPVAQPSAFLSRATLDEVALLDESLHYVMDLELWLRVATTAQVVFADEVWSNFRYHGSSKTMTTRLGFQEEVYQVVSRAFESTLRGYAERKREALAQMRMRLAVEQYTVGAGRQARRSALRAVCQHAGILGAADVRRAFVSCLVGRPCMSRIKALCGSQRQEAASA